MRFVSRSVLLTLLILAITSPQSSAGAPAAPALQGETSKPTAEPPPRPDPPQL